MHFSRLPVLKFSIFLFPFLVFCIFFWVKIFFPSAYVHMVQEDSLIEYAQALFYFAASAICLRIAFRFVQNRMAWHAFLFGVLALGLLLVSLEEISWEQRILGIDSSDFFRRNNAQSEISIHNLYGIHHHVIKGFVVVGAVGSLAWICLPLLVPKAKTTPRHIANFLVPDWYISSYFFVPLMVYLFFLLPFDVILGNVQFRVGWFVIWRDQEPVELLLSLGFLLFALKKNHQSRQCVQMSPDL